MSELLTPAQPGPEQQDAPLNEQERKLVARLFSDPTYFPVEFRTWIRAYLETSDIRLPSSAIVGGNAPRVNLPAGVILPFAGPTIPSNCLVCGGQEVLRTDYPLLFAAIGTTWGAPSGGTLFKLPDFRDRALFGQGSIIGLAYNDGRAAGSRGGPYHHHNFNQTTNSQGSHSHGLSASGSAAGVGDHEHGTDSGQFALGNESTMANPGTGTGRYIITSWSPTTGPGGGHSHSVSVSGGTDTQGTHTHNVNGDTTGGYGQDAVSYAGVIYIISTGEQV